MKRNKLILAVFATAILATGCKKDLTIANPNNPSPESLNSETGIISFASGGVYINGFKTLKYTDGVFGPFWSGATGFHELMGDVVGADAANAFLNQLGCPEKVVHDDATTVLNPNSPNKQIALIRQANNNQQAGNNFLYYEWAYMYNLISSCNLLLEKVDGVSFIGDAASKRAAIKAWAYWWKGFAYSRIGSIYYAGLINNSYQQTNNAYVTKEAIITEANANFDKAVQAANAAPSAAEFTATWERIIPGFCQTGRGLPLSPAELLRNVNTMKARNILVNKTVTDMTAADWNSILTLTNAGITSSDNIFTVRTDARGDLFSANQLIMGRTQSNIPGGATYKLSERWVQEFKTGDQRKAQNVIQGTPYLGQADRGNAHFTRFALVDGGTGLSGVAIYANTATSEYEMHLAGDYEENMLMRAEALIYTNQINPGLALIDQVRNFQGAGLAAVSGTGLTLAQAKEELRRERRIVCAFRGISFYDARRWKVIDPISLGGGRTGCVALKNTGVVSTNATIEYNYLDYWDVPGNELTYNPPGAGSAPVVNPKQ
ncbi:MAG: RagB/SusD family nutrient uptake outer membrane protein [Bacteroidetes bacterium]|nr:RagB/SusD family nutrient uptake outer membrane protein [Bacteroidota bacterium]